MELPKYLGENDKYIIGGSVDVSKRSTYYTGKQASALKGTWINMSFRYSDDRKDLVGVERSFSEVFEYGDCLGMSSHIITDPPPGDLTALKVSLSVTRTFAHHVAIGDEAPAGM